MKKKRNINVIMLLMSSLCLLIGCQRFLDVGPSSGSVNPVRIQDFQEMLNSDSLAKAHYFVLDLMSDDIQFSTTQASVTADNYFRRSYYWEQTIWFDNEIDPVYTYSYDRILQMNIILDRIADAPADELNTPENYSIVSSQARINRAWYYLQLMNAYGPAYNAATAETDLAVPLNVTVDQFALPARATVAAVYDQIIDDLMFAAASPYLPSKGATIIHPGKASAYALLARVYLYRGNYAEAEAYADSTLALENSLQDYNATGYAAPTQLVDMSGNPEILLGKYVDEGNFFSLFGSSPQLSTPLSTILISTDRRRTLRTSSLVYRATSRLTNFFDISVGVPEIMLTKAECAARNGDVTTAGTLLDELRTNRFPATSLETRSYTAENILGYVLDERRAELFFHGGMRLFDLKRLNLEGGQYAATIQRVDQSTPTTILATLEPGSPRYLLPFSPIVLAANANITQNPR